MDEQSMVMGYVPESLVLEAVVERVGVPVTTVLLVSSELLTHPLVV
jgi:hypothetical protein